MDSIPKHQAQEAPRNQAGSFKETKFPKLFSLQDKKISTGGELGKWRRTKSTIFLQNLCYLLINSHPLYYHLPHFETEDHGASGTRSKLEGAMIEIPRNLQFLIYP